jgi:hypothetical protein
MVSNLKAVWFGSRPFMLPDRLLTSLGIPFGGVKTDIIAVIELYDVPRDLCASRDFRKGKKNEYKYVIPQ